MRYLILLLLAGCQTAASTEVLHHFSDDALEIARRAAPETEWEVEVDPNRDPNYAYNLPHTELVTLRGRVEDAELLFENLEIEALRTLLRNNMDARFQGHSKGEGLYRRRWIYRWGRCEGLLTIWGSRQENGDFTLCFTIHETRIER
ncbi:MAG: hypothetical protein ACYTHK_13075 [Planctomycetota bacterium]|jgi:hypothetical protein